MFAPVTQTKAQLRVLWKAMTLLPFSLCRCVELDILLGSGQVNFKLPRKAVLAKWLCLFSSQAVPPSDTASITLPLFHAVNRVANYPPRPPSHLWPFWLENAGVGVGGHFPHNYTFTTLQLFPKTKAAVTVAYFPRKMHWKLFLQQVHQVFCPVYLGPLYVYITF